MITALGRAGTALTDEQRERYARPMLLDGMGEEGQRRLLGTSVLVIGAGGLGSPGCTFAPSSGFTGLPEVIPPGHTEHATPVGAPILTPAEPWTMGPPY